MTSIREEIADMRGDIKYIKATLSDWKESQKNVPSVIEVQDIKIRVDKIENNINKVIMGVLGAVITAVISFVIRKP